MESLGLGRYFEINITAGIGRNPNKHAPFIYKLQFFPFFVKFNAHFSQNEASKKFGHCIF